MGYIQCFSDLERTSVVVDRPFVARACYCITGIRSPDLSSALRVDMSSPRSRCLKRAAQLCHRQKPVRCRNPVVVDCPIIVGLETNRKTPSHASKYQKPIDSKSGAARLKTGAWSSKLDPASGSEQSPPRVQGSLINAYRTCHA